MILHTFNKQVIELMRAEYRYFGHYHEDRAFDDKKHTVLYHDVLKVI